MPSRQLAARAASARWRRIKIKEFFYICMQIRMIMAEKTTYAMRVEPQHVDFTLHETLVSLGGNILNVAGIDAQSKGFGVDVLGRRNLSWVLSRLAMEFDYRPEQYTDYGIATWISDYNRLMSTRNFTLTDSAGVVFGRAVSQWCMLDLATRSAVDMTTTAELHSRWIVDSPSPAERPRKVAAPAGETHTVEHRVVYSDIDFNRHVNTMRYIELMIDMLPVELLAGEHRVRMDVNFLHESRYGQTLAVTCAETGGEWRFEIRSDDGTVCLRAAMRFE